MNAQTAQSQFVDAARQTIRDPRNHDDRAILRACDTLITWGDCWDVCDAERMQRALVIEANDKRDGDLALKILGALAVALFVGTFALSYIG